MSNFYKITSKKYLRALTWRKTTYTVSYLLVLESRVSQKVALNRLRPYLLPIFECFRTVFEQKCSFFGNYWKAMDFFGRNLQFWNRWSHWTSFFVRKDQFWKKFIICKKISKYSKIFKILNSPFSVIHFCPRELWNGCFQPKSKISKKFQYSL